MNLNYLHEIRLVIEVISSRLGFATKEDNQRIYEKATLLFI